MSTCFYGILQNALFVLDVPNDCIGDAHQVIHHEVRLSKQFFESVIFIDGAKDGLKAGLFGGRRVPRMCCSKVALLVTLAEFLDCSVIEFLSRSQYINSMRESAGDGMTITFSGLPAPTSSPDKIQSRGNSIPAVSKYPLTLAAPASVAA